MAGEAILCQHRPHTVLKKIFLLLRRRGRLRQERDRQTRYPKQKYFHLFLFLALTPPRQSGGAEQTGFRLGGWLIRIRTVIQTASRVRAARTDTRRTSLSTSRPAPGRKNSRC